LIAAGQELDGHIDRLSHELRPCVSEYFGLIMALSHHLYTFSASIREFHWIFTITVSAAGGSPPSRRRLCTAEAQVQWIVEDDGFGFDPEAVWRGSRRCTPGLIEMHERVSLAGGTLNIESGSVGRTLMKKIGVFLVDDHAVLREGLRMLIDAQPDMVAVGEAAHGRDLAAAVAGSGADVVVIDLSMPGFSGARATAELKRAMPSVIVIALTRHSEKAYLQQMLESGASGYVLKQTHAEELLNAVRAVWRGGTYLDPAIAGKLVPNYATRAAAAGAGRPLSVREQEVVTMIGFGHTNKEIAATLNISVKTVEAHKARIMERLEITSRAGLVRFAMMQGWLESS
jgi:DNA-binding NarL/FixJ family response regulator